MSLIMSLRWRIAAAVAAVSAAAAIAVGLAAHQLAVSRSDNGDPPADGVLSERLIVVELTVISLALLASVLLGAGSPGRSRSRPVPHARSARGISTWSSAPHQGGLSR
jgi:hypothetical protein